MVSELPAAEASLRDRAAPTLETVVAPARFARETHRPYQRCPRLGQEYRRRRWPSTCCAKCSHDLIATGDGGNGHQPARDRRRPMEQKLNSRRQIRG